MEELVGCFNGVGDTHDFCRLVRQSRNARTSLTDIIEIVVENTHFVFESCFIILQTSIFRIISNKAFDFIRVTGTNYTVLLLCMQSSRRKKREKRPTFGSLNETKPLQRMGIQETKFQSRKMNWSSNDGKVCVKCQIVRIAEDQEKEESYPNRYPRTMIIQKHQARLSFEPCAMAGKQMRVYCSLPAPLPPLVLARSANMGKACESSAFTGPITTVSSV
ncbi:hypothetical protein M0804_007506 [Polistes exclamans]|nr:hypothetical protein M0804_007506 [Polistes exclamans]